MVGITDRRCHDELAAEFRKVYGLAKPMTPSTLDKSMRLRHGIGEKGTK
jgi:hypothetical protein